MPSVFSSWQRWLSLTPVIGAQIQLDLGSSNTRVMVGNKIIYHQPTCVLWHTQSQTVVEIGTKALQAYDKLPSAVEIVFPIRHGAVTDRLIAQQYIQSILSQSFSSPRSLPIIIGMKAIVGVPAGQTPVEKKIYQNVLANVGLGRTTYIKKAQAAYRSAQKLIKQSHMCVIDIGSQTTEVGIFFGDECVAATTILIGGETYTREIMAVLKESHHCSVGWTTAEKIKQQYRGIMHTTGTQAKAADYKSTVRGKDMITGVPVTVSISSSQLRERFALVTDDLLLQIKTFFSQIPSELLTSALEESVYFTGGGSLLSGVVEFLAQDFKCHFCLAKEPLEDVVRGLSESS